MTSDDSTFAEALAASSAPWWLVREAVASTSLDRDETHSLDEAPVTCERCGRHLPCRHCPPVGDDGLTDEERAEMLDHFKRAYGARPSLDDLAAARARWEQQQ